MAVVTGCGKQTTTNSEQIKVVSSLDFYGEAARAVLGQHGQVTTIINSPSVDPHDFEPTTKDAQTAAQANVTIANGIGYDDWMTKITTDKTKNIKVGKLMNKHDGDNEHLWYNSQTMRQLTDKLAQTYSQIDPKHRADYEKNAKKYQQQLRQLDTLIKQVKTQVNGKKADVSEPVFDYALADLGVKINNRQFENAIEKGVDPTPAAIKAIQTDITKHRIAFFVDNSQVSNPTVSGLVDLAHKNNVPVLKVTETLPKDKTYLDWMMGQYQQLRKITASTH
ncbi:metal ABC transporter solute-binding protein, Zn/Mn family [Lentilactobacillus kribbianus]|uniref:metal ABC transporter solute-binding protein, Zn/Mn family n=1 Tax=Lentilactobacillus kribbianus TaxID=2729622 RepID=UPI0015531951|nr:zinc ABC transporter substrate-binding protein [Lentilactobacillus kribbianus]